MFTGMATENQEMFRAASSGEYVYVGYSVKAIEEQIIVSTSFCNVYGNNGA
jgi:hypothetical protein